VLCELPPIDDPAVLVGTSTADDAAVYKLDDERAIVQTVDLITPIVDDPYDYGQIAAANSLSDVYAMGGTPLFALAVVCFPSQKVPLEVLGRILQGGVAKAREAGIAVVGGHSVEDKEPKYGLVVTGLVSPDHILANAGAQPGDVLVLTKPIGSGILTTALKKKRLKEEALRNVVDVMTTLNRAAAEALEGLQVHALTDITGFGLLGHLVEMVAASGVGARLKASSVPVLEEAWPLVQRGIYPGGTKRNLEHFGSSVQWSQGTSKETQLVLADPQTSGGLLVAIAPEDVDEFLSRLSAASVIGEITATPPGVVQVDAP
jgi:selenide,water dikinase